jgi:short-subunit dehydrogenase
MDFAERYGPWAVVVGASEGVGSEFAAEVARRGLDVVLLARRQEVLDDVAAAIRQESGARTRTIAVDLGEPGAGAVTADATADLDVGLLMYNAGANNDHRNFLDIPIESSLGQVHRNCIVPTELCHRYAPAMVGRGRGGIILVTSAAALAGAPNMVTYGATKAYDMIFAEALWSELHDRGVDVLSLMLGSTDTPAHRRLRAERGIVDDPAEPIPGASAPAEVVADAIEHLPDGPSRMVGEQLRSGAPLMAGLSRRELVELMTEMSGATMGG